VTRRDARPFVPDIGRPPDFHGAAACAGTDAERFYPRQGEHVPRIAKRICGACPVSDECLAWALKFPIEDQFGIWGGTSANERKTLLAARNREGGVS